MHERLQFSYRFLIRPSTPPFDSRQRPPFSSRRKHEPILSTTLAKAMRRVCPSAWPRDAHCNNRRVHHSLHCIVRKMFTQTRENIVVRPHLPAVMISLQICNPARQMNESIHSRCPWLIICYAFTRQSRKPDKMIRTDIPWRFAECCVRQADSVATPSGALGELENRARDRAQDPRS